MMEVELNILDELLDGQTKKIECLEKREDCSTVYESLKEELEKLYREYEKLVEMYEESRDYQDYFNRRVRRIMSDCRLLKHDMIGLLPSWSLPEEPILSEENEQDFKNMVEWLYEYVGYLVCLVDICSAEMNSKFGNRLYGLKKELSEVVHSWRFKTTRGDLLRASSSLRDKIHLFDDESTDVLERYLKDDSATEMLVVF